MVKHKKFQIEKYIFTTFIIGILVLVMAYPVHAKTSSITNLSLTGQRAVIIDMDFGKILYKKNANVRCHNSSTTKLATAIVAVGQNKSLKKKIRISGNASGVGSSSDTVKLGMSTGDSYYLRDLLHAMLLKSANDTSVAIAEGISGSEVRFMKQINKKMKKIGCKNTVFGTSNGLCSSNTHYTTAKDLALIMRHAYQNETLRSIMKKKSYSFKSIRGRYHTVSNTNALLNSKEYYCVGKTGNGWTAQYCFTGVYTYKGHSYVIVTLSSATETSYGKSSGKYKNTADFMTSIENRNGKFYTDKATIDEIGQIEARGEDFSLLNKKIMSSHASTEGGTSIVYKYSDELGTKYLIHQVTDANGYIIHRDFDAVRISSGQLINKGH